MVALFAGGERHAELGGEGRVSSDAAERSAQQGRSQREGNDVCMCMAGWLLCFQCVCLCVLSQEHAALKKQLEKALTGAEESQLSAKSNKEVCMA